MPRSPEQRTAALAKARRLRGEVALTAQRRLKTGEIGLADVLGNPDLQGFRLSMVLGWLPRYGPRRITKLLREAEVGPAFLEWRLRRLTDRQKAALAEVVESGETKNVPLRARAARRKEKCGG